MYVTQSVPTSYEIFANELRLLAFLLSFPLPVNTLNQLDESVEILELDEKSIHDFVDELNFFDISDGRLDDSETETSDRDDAGNCLGHADPEIQQTSSQVNRRVGMKWNVG